MTLARHTCASTVCQSLMRQLTFSRCCSWQQHAARSQHERQGREIRLAHCHLPINPATQRHTQSLGKLHCRGIPVDPDWTKLQVQDQSRLTSSAEKRLPGTTRPIPRHGSWSLYQTPLAGPYAQATVTTTPAAAAPAASPTLASVIAASRLLPIGPRGSCGFVYLFLNASFLWC